MNTFVEVPATKKSLSKRRPVCGVGINDAHYMTRFNGSTCPFYKKWHGMIRRCYDPKLHAKYHTYVNCTLSDEWLTFSSFKTWMKKQKWEGMDLDKDLLKPGNKLYSPESCVFVPQELNKLLTDGACKRGEWPIGVTFNKRAHMFKAYCRSNGRLKHLGYFNTPEEASEVYKAFKSNHVKEIAEGYKSNTRLYRALISHADLIIGQKL